MAIIGIIFALYLGLMVLIGLKYYSKTSNISDYILGGRKLNSWVAAMSAQASDMSGWLLLGLPGTAYILYTGTSEAIWTAIGLWIGTYLNWLFVAKRLRSYTQVASDALTLPDFLRKDSETENTFFVPFRPSTSSSFSWSIPAANLQQAENSFLPFLV